MEATYGRSIWSTAAFNGFDLPNVSICYILTWLRCLWATAELQNSWLCGPSFQLGNPKFLPGTAGTIILLIVATDSCCIIGTGYFFVFGCLLFQIWSR